MKFHNYLTYYEEIFVILVGILMSNAILKLIASSSPEIIKLEKLQYQYLHQNFNFSKKIQKIPSFENYISTCSLILVLRTKFIKLMTLSAFEAKNFRKCKSVKTLDR